MKPADKGIQEAKDKIEVAFANDCRVAQGLRPDWLKEYVHISVLMARPLLYVARESAWGRVCIYTCNRGSVNKVYDSGHDHA